MSKVSNECAVECRKAGIAHERCGPAVRDLLLELRQEPLKTQVSSYGGAKMPKHASMGVAIKAGLARFIGAERMYVITPLGETWLSELEIHGLLNLGRSEA